MGGEGEFALLESQKQKATSLLRGQGGRKNWRAKQQNKDRAIINRSLNRKRRLINVAGGGSERLLSRVFPLI